MAEVELDFWICVFILASTAVIFTAIQISSVFLDDRRTKRILKRKGKK